MQLTYMTSALPNGPFSLMYRMYRFILPGVRGELQRWRAEAEQIPDGELRRQAIASMTSKEFHCIGGAVYAIGNSREREALLRLITAFQTISDYLDNLCDRSTSLSADDFRTLHLAMTDAVDPSGDFHDYYAHREETDDGGYLRGLVETCRMNISQLSSYASVQPYVLDLVQLYCDLQVYKHIHPSLREQALLDWWEQHKHRCPDLAWYEFAAATGSTLGVFMLFMAASEPGLSKQEAAKIQAGYFPYICALHILLDYLIDQEEDRHGGDLNFCSYYASSDDTVNRLISIADAARASVSQLPAQRFHHMVIEGLLALYLSDPKVAGQAGVKRISRRLMSDSPWTRVFFWFNSKWIRKR